MVSFDKIIKSLKNDVTFSSHRKVAAICAPLYKIGVNSFTYIKNFKDGRRVDLCTDQDFTRLFYQKYYNLEYVDNVLLEKNVANRKISYRGELDDNLVAHDALEYGIVNRLALMKKDTETSEIFYYASSNPTCEMQKIYFDNLDYLNKFSFYFKEQAASLIDLSSQSNLRIPKQYDQLVLNKIKHTDKTQSLMKNDMAIYKYLFDAKGENKYLTPREIECIEWCAKGKTSFETGLILGITPKTVELHLYNSRKKLNCVNKCQLVSEVIRLGILL